MRISHIKITNFRKFKTVELNLDNYAALIGPNNTGKSTILYAIATVLGERSFGEEDFNDSNLPVVIEFQITDFNVEEHSSLSQYIHNNIITFKKEWRKNPVNNNINLTSSYKFHAEMVPGINDLEDYQIFKTDFSELKLVSAKNFAKAIENIESFLKANKNDPWQDAKYIWPAIKEKYDCIFISASTNKDINDYVQTIFTSYVDEIDPNFKIKLKEQASIDPDLEKHLEKIKQKIEEEINSRITNKELPITISSQIVQKPEVKWKINIGEKDKNISVGNQGHGFQRELLFSLLQTKAKNFLIPTKSKIILIEEPELYQHPQRRKHLAKIFLDWVDEHDGNQMILASHSEAFISVNRFYNIHIFSPNQNKIQKIQPNQSPELSELASNKFLHRELPNQFAEAFFAKKVVLVEGPGDVGVLNGILGAQNIYPDEHNVAILSAGSNTNLPAPYHILTNLQIPVFIIMDSDNGDRLDEYQKHYSFTKKYQPNDPSIFDKNGILLKGNLELALSKSPEFVNALIKYNLKEAITAIEEEEKCPEKRRQERIKEIQKVAKSENFSHEEIFSLLDKKGSNQIQKGMFILRSPEKNSYMYEQLCSGIVSFDSKNDQSDLFKMFQSVRNFILTD